MRTLHDVQQEIDLDTAFNQVMEKSHKRDTQRWKASELQNADDGSTTSV